MRAWIQRCPSCGYCGFDASKFDNRLRPVLEGEAYRAQLADIRYPELSSTFICTAMLAEALGQPVLAGQAWLYAAWTLDDSKEGDLAGMCRGKAADKFLGILADGNRFCQKFGASEAITVDCLRRAGRGPEALRLIEWALSKGFGEVAREILLFQRLLVERGDISRHTMKEALEGR